jgi:hypothetical protein
LHRLTIPGAVIWVGEGDGAEDAREVWPLKTNAKKAVIEGSSSNPWEESLAVRLATPDRTGASAAGLFSEVRLSSAGYLRRRSGALTLALRPDARPLSMRTHLAADPIPSPGAEGEGKLVGSTTKG